jgi:hypothetical protein
LTRAQVIIIFDETVNAVKVFDDLFPKPSEKYFRKKAGSGGKLGISRQKLSKPII